jgi:ribosomal protein L32E
MALLSYVLKRAISANSTSCRNISWKNMDFRLINKSESWRDPRGCSFLNHGGVMRKLNRTDSFAVAHGFRAMPPVQQMRPSSPGMKVLLIACML